MENTNLVPLADIRWTYDLVHSQMFYNGLSLDEACVAIENTFDGTQPQGLFDAVKRYHEFRMNKEVMK